MVLTGTPKSLSDRSFDFGSPYFNGLAAWYWGGSNTNMLVGRSGRQLHDTLANVNHAFTASTINGIVDPVGIQAATTSDSIVLDIPTTPLTNDLPGIYNDFTVLHYCKIINNANNGSLFRINNVALDQYIDCQCFLPANPTQGQTGNLAFRVKGANALVTRFAGGANGGAAGVQQTYGFMRKGLILSNWINGTNRGNETLANAGAVNVDGLALIGRGQLSFGSSQNTATNTSLLVVYKRALSDAEMLALHQNPFLALPDPGGVIVPPDDVRKSAKVFHLGNSVTDTIKYPKLRTIAAANKVEYIYGRQIIPGAPLDWLKDHPSDGFIEAAFGFPSVALPGFDWKVLTLQPFDRSLSSDTASCQYFMNMAFARPGNAAMRTLIYSRWARQISDGAGGFLPYNLPTNWIRVYIEGTNAFNETKSFFEQLLLAVRAANAGKVVDICPVGDALALFDTRARAGQIPGFTEAVGLFADGIHFTDVGAYLVSCTFYSTIYRESPHLLGFAEYAGVTQSLATIIHNVVWDTVLGHPYSGVTVTEPDLPNPSPDRPMFPPPELVFPPVLAPPFPSTPILIPASNITRTKEIKEITANTELRFNLRAFRLLVTAASNLTVLNRQYPVNSTFDILVETAGVVKVINAMNANAETTLTRGLHQVIIQQNRVLII